MNKVEFKVFVPEDVCFYKRDLVSLMKNVLSDNITQQYPDDLAEEYVKKMPAYIEDGSAIIVGALSDGSLAGFSWAYELKIFNERRIHIDMIGVNPAYRRNGIARRLVEMQIEEAKRRNITIIEAMTTRANENSYNWFHSMGFADERVKVKLEIDK